MSKNKLLAGMIKADNTTVTANGDVSNKSTLNTHLDFFSRAGSLRTDKTSAYKLFIQAFDDEAHMATKLLMWLRDCRGGAGEREVFRNILTECAKHTKYDKMFQPHILKLIAEYGRWDDILVLLNTKHKDAVVQLCLETLSKDAVAAEGESISLLGKWMPSINTESLETKRDAHTLCKAFGWQPAKYRKVLSALRAKLKVVERDMCAKQWGKIEYQKVSSYAMSNYRKAFKKHDELRFDKFMTKVEKGEEKINASVLFPYDIYNKVKKAGSEVRTLNAQWAALPNFIDNDKNVLCLADVSGSMESQISSKSTVSCMDVSVSLALYTAERLNGPFKNYFITFDTNPKLLKIVGNTASEKMRWIQRTDWGGSTDLDKAYQLILNHAVLNKVSQEDMPTTLLIISDMQFNQGCGYNGNKTAHQRNTASFKAAGYKVPRLVYWQVNGANNNTPSTKDEMGIMVSGFSPAILKTALNERIVTPLDMMLETINSKRYDFQF